MLRATVWTVGLFGVGTAISRLAPGTWTEPVVLLALGIVLLFVSNRTARDAPRPARTRRAPPEVGPLAAKVAAAKAATPAAVAAAAAVQGGTVQVERSV